MTRVIIVEEEKEIRRDIGINMRAKQYEVEEEGDGTSALRTAAANPPDLVILDLGLPDMDGNGVVQGVDALAGLGQLDERERGRRDMDTKQRRRPGVEEVQCGREVFGKHGVGLVADNLH